MSEPLLRTFRVSIDVVFEDTKPHDPDNEMLLLLAVEECARDNIANGSEVNIEEIFV